MHTLRTLLILTVMTRVGVHTSSYTKVTSFFPRTTLQKAEPQTNIRVLLNEWPQSIPRE